MSDVALLEPTVQVQIEYPESDGQPMAETDTHRDDMTAVIEGLKYLFRNRSDAYVTGNLFLYYEKGNPSAVFAPDVFVVFGVSRHERRTYKLWEEGKIPAVVIEMTSRSTWLEDEGTKKAICARLGVPEYFLYDPLAEYLDPPLQGFRLVAGFYQPMSPEADSSILSTQLGVRFWLEDGRIRMTDARTGERILTPQEALEARRAAEARAQGAEAELARLRAELARLRRDAN